MSTAITSAAAKAVDKWGRGVTDTVNSSGSVSMKPAHSVGCVHAAQQSCLMLSKGRSLYAAQGSRLADPRTPLGHLDLIIDLAGLVKRKAHFVVEGPKRFTALNSVILPEVVRFDWPDMTAPIHVRLDFWKALLAKLPQHTAVACVGGHGRTGTALAALLVADGEVGTEAIVRVRRDHCTRAIETPEQERYIRELA